MIIVDRNISSQGNGVNVSGGMLITGTSVELVSENKQRIFFNIDNIGESLIFINFGATATSGEGLKLKAGEKWEMTEPVNIAAINAVCETTTGADICFMEY